LVELLVVIGIIAALIGILLPVLSGVQARGRDLKCQSNIRQICQAILGYCAENKGSMPYGFYWNRSVNHLHPQGNPDPYATQNTWQAAGDNPGSSGDPDNSAPFISWASMVGKYMVKRAGGDNDDINFPPVLLCPEAQQEHDHVVSYVINMIVGVAPIYERQLAAAPRAQISPPKQTLMLKETAIIWDTPIKPNWQNNVGYLMGADIDGQRFWNGASIPQFRYYRDSDPFGRLPPGAFGQNRPVQLDVGSVVYENRDSQPSESWPWQGNLRFRHGKGTQCNVGFADGSVRQFTGKFNSNKRLRDNTPLTRSHDALRRYFMIKWPPGVPAAPGTP
jgi:prepilin-type processing-associated H-X9-DG protein